MEATGKTKRLLRACILSWTWRSVVPSPQVTAPSMTRAFFGTEQSAARLAQKKKRSNTQRRIPPSSSRQLAPNSLSMVKMAITRFPRGRHRSLQALGFLLAENLRSPARTGVSPVLRGCGFFGDFFRFTSGRKMSYFTAFSRKIDAFYTSPATSPASFSTSPTCPTNIPSITNKL